ncbi:PAS-domain containing protein [Xanthobacter sp. KR7-225]|uniref:PAS domain-containing sensor histidine kinase n=1 Tax=Xanthobacter sp. KR7-225 TaxID=3156613 RepID=UPI0032B3D018
MAARVRQRRIRNAGSGAEPSGRAAARSARAPAALPGPKPAGATAARLRAKRLAGPALAAFVSAPALALLAAGPAEAAPQGLPPDLLSLWVPLFAAGALTLAGLGAMRLHRRARRAEALARADGQAAARARAQLRTLKALLVRDAPHALAWSAPDEAPEPIGLPEASFSPLLGAAAAEQAQAALVALRASAGEAHVARSLTGADGRHFALEGHALGGAGIVLLRALAQADAAPHDQGLKALLDALPAPVWQRRADGALAYANAAFLRVVGAASLDQARTGGLDLLDAKARAAAGDPARQAGPFRGRLKAVAEGRRCQFDVVEVAGPFGSAGCAIDVTEAESARAETARTVAAHRRTLDQLTTAVAIFGADARLVFHNAAYERLFDLPPAFLDQHPSDGEILEDLRVRRKLPEQANFGAWRTALKEAYRAIEPVNDFWHLPGGQMLRVVITPNAEGGVTYLFDDLSEHMALESRYNSLIRIQGETLDGLAEAVAVFGSDGRLDLYNEAFLALWSLDAQALGEKPHIDAVAAMCRPLHGESSAFSRIRGVVTAIERREPQEFRIERPDARVLDGTAQPLPDGGTMVTFRDVTDSAQIERARAERERALVERNEALEAADKLKNAFVGHVSYHLRTPLNTLVGYADMLREGIAGPLSARQREYLDHMRQSSDALRALIDDLIDLAAIDAGAMELDLSEVDVAEALAGAADAARDLVEAAKVRLEVTVAPGAGSFIADPRRVRQILFNLLANAISVSPEGARVTLSAERRPDGLALAVRDEGPGVPPEVAQSLFERFESRSAGPRHRGVGLGLSIVRSFVELHGGTVSVKAAGGRGSLATCLFPATGAARHEAAE